MASNRIIQLVTRALPVLVSLVIMACGQTHNTALHKASPQHRPKRLPQSERVTTNANLQANMNKGASTPVESRACLGLPEDKPSSPASKGLNVLNTSLSLCSEQPVTGWFRDGHCRTSAQDRGQHTVCAEMTERFLRFTASKGNDLSSPSLRHGFAGLRPGDRWCLCAARWAEAYRAGVAPKPILQATEQSSLQVIALDVLVKQAQADSVD